MTNERNQWRAEAERRYECNPVRVDTAVASLSECDRAEDDSSHA